MSGLVLKFWSDSACILLNTTFLIRKMQHFLNGTSFECSEHPPFIVLMMTPHVQDLVSHAAVNTQILGRSSSLVLPNLKVPNKIWIFSPSNNCSGGDFGGKSLHSEGDQNMPAPNCHPAMWMILTCKYLTNSRCGEGSLINLILPKNRT